MRTSVIIPTYNERGNITPLIDEILRFCPEAEVIVVDDDSPDKTWQAVDEKAKRDERVLLIRRVGRRGLVTAIQEGIDKSKREVVVWMDSDFSMPPGVIPSMLERLENNDIVVASRYVKGGRDKRPSFIRIFSSWILNKFARYILGTKVKDLTSGFVAARKDVFKNLSLSGTYGEYFIRLISEAERKGYRTEEIPYICSPRFKGQTKTSPGLLKFLSLGMLYLIMIFKIRFSKAKRL